MWEGADEYIPDPADPKVSDEEIRAYIRETKTIVEYSCWGPNKWHSLSYEEAKRCLIEIKKKRRTGSWGDV